MDSNTPSWPETLPLPSTIARPQTIPRSTYTLMASGRRRKRRMLERSLEMIEVSWNFVEDKFSVFKTFFEETLLNGELSFSMELFGEEKEIAFFKADYAFTRSDNLFNVTATLEIVADPLAHWDYTSCAIVSDEADGDSFDCYPVGDYPGLLFQQNYYLLTLQGGSGLDLSSEWIWSDNPSKVMSEDFEDYNTGAVAVPLLGGEGFLTDSPWRFG